jgi:hypothetical protein
MSNEGILISEAYEILGLKEDHLKNKLKMRLERR